MSLLDHPDAQALLADATISTEAVRDCRDRMTRFLKRYLPRFYRQEQRQHAAAVVCGLLRGYPVTLNYRKLLSSQEVNRTHQH
jgi:hypothetical protein